MMKVCVVWVCVSCLVCPALTQANDLEDCAGGVCAEEQMHFDLMHVKQTLHKSIIERKTEQAQNEFHSSEERRDDICSPNVPGDCLTCVLTDDPWCGENPWDNLCYYACCGSTAYASNGCEAACSGSSVCTAPTPIPPELHATGEQSLCVDGDWHEVGEASHNCAWTGEDPAYRCSDPVNEDGIQAWEVCKQTCGNCGCADGDWHEVGEESHDCAWAGEDPSYRCSDPANVDGLKAWQVCLQSCGLCTECVDGDWYEVGEESHNCAWAGEDPSYRCSDAANAEGLKAWQVCKESCGLCDECVDDPAWHEASDPSHDCAWVAQTMLIDPSTCNSAMGGGASPVPAWSGCPMACGACPEPPEEPSVLNDPHMTSLGGEKFDINQPADHVLLRAPLEPAQSALFELRAKMEADEVTPCGLYVKAVTLSGTWFGDAIVHVRPLKRNKAGSNTAGNTTEWPFSIQFSSQDPWTSFSDLSSGNGVKALTDSVKVTAASREQFGGLLEGQAFTFHIRRGVRPAVVVVSQAAHQALNVELVNMKALGQRTLGGLLGTEKHSKGVEELTEACKAHKGKEVVAEGKTSLLGANKLLQLTASWS